MTLLEFEVAITSKIATANSDLIGMMSHDRKKRQLLKGCSNSFPYMNQRVLIVGLSEATADCHYLIFISSPRSEVFLISFLVSHN